MGGLEKGGGEEFLARGCEEATEFMMARTGPKVSGLSKVRS